MLNACGLSFCTVLALLMGLAPLLTQHPAQADSGYGRQASSDPEQSRMQASDQPPVFQTGTLGLCHLYNLSGYFAIDSNGTVVPLQPYCRSQQNWVWYAEGRFWRTFRRMATAEAMAFAQTQDQQAVEAYALSICTLLNDERLTPATAVQTLETVQANGSVPAAFDQAVTQAAVRTYCPEHRSAMQSVVPSAAKR